ncbi:TetR/AcrR family transcriptional regulator [Sinorhizobium sp. 7-81]|uniref:TetR/AcrR family transcriptional regulator n=1 Tax=Sinorhizobium sp. 8-89 TaxID=3049089 RepID=UPI0024C228BB|nr:TetR/AcrR family transcriptional regulator [Sinorhizobium sp. 8-89]MDK1493258.1 TetR/AcrR family transcriptional regulator [Sinorhizobium sp. 8-89]
MPKGCARILEVAEEYFRRIGHQKTSVADIASELGISRANIYRFFPSKDAISESVCGRIVNDAADLALTIARTSVSPLEKLDQVLTAVHHHTKTQLTEAKRMHDLVTAAVRENWPAIKAYDERMIAIFEAIIREGIEAGAFEIEDAAEAARAVNTAVMPFVHPSLIEHCVQRGGDSEVALREQIRFVLKALGKSDNAGCPYSGL